MSVSPTCYLLEIWVHEKSYENLRAHGVIVEQPYPSFRFASGRSLCHLTRPRLDSQTDNAPSLRIIGSTLQRRNIYRKMMFVDFSRPCSASSFESMRLI